VHCGGETPGGQFPGDESVEPDSEGKSLESGKPMGVTGMK